MSFDLVGFGVASLDRIEEVDVFPAPGGKTKILSREEHGGGLTATALVAAAKLGVSCLYGGPLGDNDVSHQVRRILREYGVTVPDKLPYPVDAEPILATVYVEKRSGERTIFGMESMTPPPRLNPETHETALNAKCLFVDQFYPEALLPLYRQARAKGIPIVGDFETLEIPFAKDALGLTNHPILPAALVRHYYGDDIPSTVLKLLRENDRSAVVVTDGVRGAWFAERGDVSVRHQPVFPVTVRDTTGCGDVFHGAYAAALIFGMPLADRVRFASAAAALKATRIGGQTGAPTRAELDAFLANSPTTVSK